MGDLLGGAVVGALVSEPLKSLIKKAKKYKAFKPLSEDLVSTMERLLLVILEIESMQEEQEFGVGELKELKDTIEKAHALVNKFPSVTMLKKPRYTTKIMEINEAMDKFCKKDLQLFQYRNQLSLLGLTGTLVDKVDGLSKRMEESSVPVPVFTDICSVPKLDKDLIGFDWPLIELKKRLLDKTVVRLVVSAPPGCGKTTLVTHLCHDSEVKKKFKHIFFHVVSSTSNFRMIVQKLLQHNGVAPPIFDNDSEANVALRKLLEKLREDGILLVLDDVWHGADSLLENFRITIPDYKVLVSSRSEFPGFGSSYYLKPLKDEDARALFNQWASQPDNSSPAEYEHLLQKILKRCNGFPIVIEVVGVSLSGRPLRTWKGQVDSWSEGETILDSPSVLERLQPSFSALKPQLKECFMDMGSFLEDQKIPASVIIDLWAELYDISSSSLCMKHLDDLASQNLLKLVPLGNEQDDGFYNEYLVTQHDILRELAIHQSELEENLERKRLNLEIREDKFPDWCSNPRHPNPIINASLLSISTDDSFTSSWVEMECPNVEVLVLNLSSSNYALPNFIATMKKLKVLIIINHGSYSAILSNFSCLTLLPNLKRIRMEKVSVTLLNILQLQLVSLKKLSFVMCSFGEVFYDCVYIDVSKALPSLQEIDLDYCYDLHELPYWVSEAVSLKTLSITNCHKLSRLPEAIGSLSKLEILRLSSCIDLCELPESTDRLSNLRFLDISHCSRLRKLPIKIGKLQKLKKISMINCGKCQLPDSVINLEDLEVKCDEETASWWERLKPKMRNLSVHEEETVHNLNKLLMF